MSFQEFPDYDAFPDSPGLNCTGQSKARVRPRAADSEDDSSPCNKKAVHLRGIPNIGNSCYLGAILVGLWGLPETKERIM